MNEQNKNITITRADLREVADMVDDIATYFKYSRRCNTYDTDTARAHIAACIAMGTVESLLADDEEDKRYWEGVARDNQELMRLTDVEFDHYARYGLTPGQVAREMPTGKDLLELKGGHPIPYRYALWLVVEYGNPSIVPEQCMVDFKEILNEGRQNPEKTGEKEASE